MSNFDPPKLRNDFVIVANREKPDLAAIAISHLYRPGLYLPMFSYSSVEVSQETKIKAPDIYAIQRRRAEEFAVFLSNAIIENGGCENLIFLGLTLEQKSYLLFLRQDYNILEIDDHGDISPYLSGFSYHKAAPIECSQEQCQTALCHALINDRILQIGQHNNTIEDIAIPGESIVVIEKKADSDVIVAIAYASTINAGILLVNELQKDEDKDVLYLLESWQKGNPDALADLKNKINARIGNIDFSNYEFATFFTDGLPYSICVPNVPTSLVNLEYRPDFFVFNAIISEKREGTGSAAIFSPGFFKDEEVTHFINLFEFQNYYLRKLIGDAATVYNLKNTVEIYPFELLHICSHGGEIRGTSCAVEFTADDGLQHIIEFDHVLSVALTPIIDKHIVESMYYFRKLDGLEWRSEALKEKKYSHELYASMISRINKAFHDKKVIHKGEVPKVANTNAIKCTGFNYFANFDQFGDAFCHPVIFNNACWSWMKVSSSFLVAGARGYIGTLKEVVNKSAVRFSECFYEEVFKSNILKAFHKASLELLQNDPEIIYIYWGLHFSTLKNSNPVGRNRLRVLGEVTQNLKIWTTKLQNKEGVIDLIQARIIDARWMQYNIIRGDINGHTPPSKPVKS